MPDLQLEEKCPCGNSIKLSGPASFVLPQITSWHRTHNPHVTKILKSMESLAYPPVTVSPVHHKGDKFVKGKDYSEVDVEIAEPMFGAQVGKGTLRTHPPTRCAGEICCIHNPSDHHMKDWEQNWRGDKGMMERLCPDHGTGHPDPDDIKVRTTEWAGVHGCCGCCAPPGSSRIADMVAA